MHTKKSYSDRQTRGGLGFSGRLDKEEFLKFVNQSLHIENCFYFEPFHKNLKLFFAHTGFTKVSFQLIF